MGGMAGGEGRGGRECVSDSMQFNSGPYRIFSSGPQHTTPIRMACLRSYSFSKINYSWPSDKLLTTCRGGGGLQHLLAVFERGSLMAVLFNPVTWRLGVWICS